MPLLLMKRRIQQLSYGLAGVVLVAVLFVPLGETVSTEGNELVSRRWSPASAIVGTVVRGQPIYLSVTYWLVVTLMLLGTGFAAIAIRRVYRKLSRSSVE